MKKRILKLCFVAAAVLSLSGCFSNSLDDLYAVPAAPKDYENLQNRINEVISAGGELTAPRSGEKIQSVQLQDLDGDGVQEAITFFRVAGADSPMKIYIFRQVGEDYEQAAVIEGTAQSINSVSYEDLDGVPGKEIVVSWQISDQLHFLAAYSLNLAANQTQAEVVELMRADYTDFTLLDLDGDGQTEILILRYDGGEGGGQADCYNFKDGAFCLDSTAPVSAGATSLQEKKTGYLKGSVPALFTTSSIPSEEYEKAYITDIFAWRGGRLENITLDETTGRSAEENVRYLFTAAGCTDINGDGVTEVPQPRPSEMYMSAGQASDFWLVTWRQYALDGTSTTLYTTYYNNTDGWFFVLPDEWIGNLTLSRNDVPGGGERCVAFSYRPQGALSGVEVPFLNIYKLTGSNSQQRAKLPGRFSLQPGDSDTDVIYAAMFEDGGWDCGLDEAGVIERFHRIPTDWAWG